MKSHVNCQGCGVQGKERPPSGATIADHCDPGWKPCLTSTGGCYYFCSTCRQRLGELADEIMKIVADKNLYFPSLVKMKEPS